MLRPQNVVVGWVIPLVLSVALCVLILLAPKDLGAWRGGPAVPAVGDYLDKLRTVHDLARERHVAAPETEALFEDSLQGMLQGLDPYSAYFNPKDFKEFWGDTEGEFGGLGIQIEMDAEDRYLTVVTPLEDTPAYRQGILPGDRILEIEGEPTKGMRLEDAVRKLRGDPGSAVRILLLHRDAEEPVPMSIVRAMIHVKSIKDARVVDPERKIGYIRITSFQKSTAEEFRDELKRLLDGGMKALVIDLRFNGGGLLEQAVNLVDLFLDPDPPNDVIVSTRGRRPQEDREYRATREDTIAKGLPVAVLTNEGTASASEIVAGALRDHRIGALVGMRTFGKGSVQSVIPLADESAVKLTTARYFTPSGVSINREPGKKDYGLEPDVTVDVDSKFHAALIEAWSKRAVIDPTRKAVDPAAPADGTKPFVDVQLEKALEVLRDRLDGKSWPEPAAAAVPASATADPSAAGAPASGTEAPATDVPEDESAKSEPLRSKPSDREVRPEPSDRNVLPKPPPK